MPARGLPRHLPLTTRMEFRTEKKYIISTRHAALAETVLRAHCRPDPDFAKGSVHSVYYDSLDLQFLTEKIDSTYLKAKVRLRWYGDWKFHADPGPAFLETKIKEGGKQRKIRLRVEPDGNTLASLPLTAPELTALPALLARRGVGLGAGLRPAFTISYRRLRFVDPMTGTRVALDRDIHVPKSNLASLGPGYGALPVAVIETKGAANTLPPYLAPLVAMGLKPDSFSKYLHCYHLLMQQPL